MPDAPQNQDISVAKFTELPFGWVDGTWDTLVVELPDGTVANLLVLTSPSGQFGMYFSPEAMHALGEKAIRAATRAKLHVQGEKVLDSIIEASKNGHAR